MRIGIVGLGRIGAFHGSNLSSLDQVEELVVFDADGRAVADAASRIAKTRPADSVEEVLESGIRGVVVAAATNAQADLLVSSVQAGIPTFCEKPIAATASKAVAVCDRVAGTDVPIQIGYPRRIDPAGAGLCVPDDVSVVGYDGTSIGELGTIDLTSVEQPLHWMGEIAVEQLMDRMTAPAARGRHSRLAAELVVRGTSGPPSTT